ncbi:MAG: nucleotidyltransferase domain-containing protein [Gammaproteobacteria bacterium]|nr:nucleotidyltransferase domain-containing protein [Gammaproteobacteria bacterium]
MNKPTLDIDPQHLDIVRDILHRYVPQYAVWAFGSRTTGKAKPYSDLDLAIVTEKPLAPTVAGELCEAFTESNLPWRVDILDWATTGVVFRKIIEQDKVVMKTPEAIDSPSPQTHPSKTSHVLALQEEAIEGGCGAL